MHTLEEARADVLAALRPHESRTLSLREAAGCALAVDVVAPHDVPPFANSSVDGYAVQAADTAAAPVTLAVVDSVPAGGASRRVLGAGEAIRIMTGAPLPEGADAVVMQEHTESTTADGITILRGVDPEAGVRRAGSDMQRGATVLTTGTELRPPHLGVLASLGRYHVEVVRRTRVGVLSTGDELVTGSDRLPPGKIHESNRDLLLAMVREANAVPVDLGIVPDDVGALAATIEDARGRCDVIVSSGGVSVGEHDIVRLLLTGAPERPLRWMQLAIRPGKPFVHGPLGTVDAPLHYIGLAGNPVSALVSFELLVRPALRRLMGHRALDRPTVRCTVTAPLPASRDGRTHYARVAVQPGPEGYLEAIPVGAQGSHMLADAMGANGLAIVPPAGDLVAGSSVEVLLLHP